MAAALNTLLAFFVVFFSCLAHADLEEAEIFKPRWPRVLRADVDRIHANFEGGLGIYVEDLNDNTNLNYNASKPYYLASAIKLFVMVEIYRLIEEKKLLWQDTVEIKRPKYRDGAGYVNWMAVGKHITIRKLVDFMMKKSDNAATDILIDIAGLKAIEDTAKKYGVVDLGPLTTMLGVRKTVWRQIHPLAGNLTALDYMELWKIRNYDAKLPLFAKLIGKPHMVFTKEQVNQSFRKFYGEGYNSASLVTVADFLKKLDSGEVVNPNVSEAMIALLKKCKTGLTRIKKGLPKGWQFAHKTGTQHRRICDIGIAYGPEKQKLTIAICATDFTSLKNAESILAKTTKALIDATTLKELPIPGYIPEYPTPKPFIDNQVPSPPPTTLD